MTDRVRLLTGTVSVAIFSFMGVTFLGEGSTILGYVLIGLGLYRGYHLVLDLYDFFVPEEDDEEATE